MYLKKSWNWNTTGLEGIFCEVPRTAWVVGHLNTVKEFLQLMVRCRISLWSNDQVEKRKIDLEIISSIWDCIIYVTASNAPFFASPLLQFDPKRFLSLIKIVQSELLDHGCINITLDIVKSCFVTLKIYSCCWVSQYRESKLR